jgi:hypothetical protein
MWFYDTGFKVQDKTVIKHSKRLNMTYKEIFTPLSNGTFSLVIARSRNLTDGKVLEYLAKDGSCTYHFYDP